jgi:outer membrane cobalamin receptor
LWAGQSISIGITGYHSSVKDWILWNPSKYEPWFPENIPEVVSQGLEASLHWQANVQDWKLGTSLQYAFTHTTDTSRNNVQLPYIPVNQGNGFVSLGYHQYYLRWNISYTGERATTLDAKKNEINMLPGYWLNHITVGRTFQIRKLDLETRIKMYNVFDVDYQAVVYRAMPGRHVDLTLKVKL